MLKTYSTFKNPSTIKSQSTTILPSTISKSDYSHNDHGLFSLPTIDIRNSMRHISPLKPQSSCQQHTHSQLVIKPATTTSVSTTQGTTTTTTTTSTLFVAPRVLNFQTIVPKPTNNIQIGNTKIILVSPSNITQHLPHSTTSTTTSQQQNLVSNSSVKLVKFASTNNNNNPIMTRTTTLPTNTTQSSSSSSSLTLPKNVQIVIPPQTSSAIQLTRTRSEDLNHKSLSTAYRSVTTATSIAFTPCTMDQIPQAAQEITIAASSGSSPTLTTNASDLQKQSSIGIQI